MRVMLIQVDRLLHEQRILTHCRLVFVSLRRWYAVASFLASEGAETVVLGMTKHSQDGTGTDRSVVCRIHERSTSRTGGVRLPHRIVLLPGRLRPIVRGINELVM